MADMDHGQQTDLRSRWSGCASDCNEAADGAIHARHGIDGDGQEVWRPSTGLAARNKARNWLELPFKARNIWIMYTPCNASAIGQLDGSTFSTDSYRAGSVAGLRGLVRLAQPVRCPCGRSIQNRGPPRPTRRLGSSRPPRWPSSPPQTPTPNWRLQDGSKRPASPRRSGGPERRELRAGQRRPAAPSAAQSEGDGSKWAYGEYRYGSARSWTYIC
jgi:hypothetical protein